MNNIQVREPTYAEIKDNAKVFETEEAIGYAMWYPQMGGYGG